MRHKFKKKKIITKKKKIINLHDYFYTIVCFFIYIRTTLNILYTYIMTKFNTIKRNNVFIYIHIL